jgi:hypothetical protein
LFQKLKFLNNFIAAALQQFYIQISKTEKKPIKSSGVLPAGKGMGQEPHTLSSRHPMILFPVFFQP